MSVDMKQIGEDFVFTKENEEKAKNIIARYQ